MNILFEFKFLKKLGGKNSKEEKKSQGEVLIEDDQKLSIQKQ